MTRDLAADVVAYLTDHGRTSADAISRGIRARRQDVLQVLRSDERVSEPFVLPGGAKLYHLAFREAGVPGRARMGRSTHCGRILGVLSDGRWHLAAELYQVGGIVHSRVSQLRKRGHLIECERIGPAGPEGYRYRLVNAAARRAA